MCEKSVRPARLRSRGCPRTRLRNLAFHLVSALFVIVAPWAGAARAATTTTTFTVQITITTSCVINSAGTLNFGSQGVLAANVDQTSTIQVQCTNTTPYTVGIDAGASSGATVTTRKMTNGANTISYSLFRDAARTQNWGTTIGTDTVAGTGSGAAQNITVYGRVPTQTTPAAAVYTDTVTVTVTY
jgi:spore coat protein U-like protein